jgi:hypothetical protein
MPELFRYAQIEPALFETFNVSPEGMGAFRANIRYLRRYDVLGERPGSGNKIDYSHRMVLGMALALEIMNALGQPPRLAALNSRVIMGQYRGDEEVFWARIVRGERLTTLAMSEPALQALLEELLGKRPVRAFSLVNVAMLAEQVNAALDVVAET